MILKQLNGRLRTGKSVHCSLPICGDDVSNIARGSAIRSRLQQACQLRAAVQPAGHHPPGPAPSVRPLVQSTCGYKTMAVKGCNDKILTCARGADENEHSAYENFV